MLNKTMGKSLRPKSDDQEDDGVSSASPRFWFNFTVRNFEAKLKEPIERHAATSPRINVSKRILIDATMLIKVEEYISTRMVVATIVPCFWA